MPPFLADEQGAYVSLTLRPATRLRVEQVFLYQRLQTLPGTELPSKQMVFDTHLVRWKANLQITKALALRAIVDYNQLASNRSLFSEAGSSRLMGDALATYVLHPGTAIYAGFNNRYENLVLDGLSESRFLRTGPPTFSVGRQMFVKVSYLLRF